MSWRRWLCRLGLHRMRPWSIYYVHAPVVRHTVRCTRCGRVA